MIRQEPADLTAEAALLNAALLATSTEAAATVVRELIAQDFYSNAHRRIYEAIVAANALGPVDVVTVTRELKRSGRFSEIGDALHEIVNPSTPGIYSGRHLAQYIEILREKRQARQLVRIGNLLAASGYADAPPAQIKANALAELEWVQASSPTIEIVSGAALAQPLPPISYLCDGLRLTHGSPTIWAGNSFAGKSLAGADLVVAVASGGDVFGSFRCRQGRALMLDYDGQGRRISQERFQRLARGRGVDLRELGDAIGYVRKPGFYLDDADALDRLCRLLDGATLCVIDSWRGCTPATDEWLRGPVQKIGDVLETVSTKTGCVVVVVDHHIKPAREGNGKRSKMHDLHGSTAKAEMAQSHFAFEGEEGEQFSRIKHVKERVTGLTVSPFGLRFEDVEEHGDRRWGLRVTFVDRAEFEDPVLSPEEREAEQATAKRAKAAEKEAERAEKERRDAQTKHTRARQREDELRRQLEQDDAAARELLRQFPDLAKRELIAKLKAARACGFERADDALRRVAPPVGSTPPPSPASPASPASLASPESTSEKPRPPSPEGTDRGSPLGGEISRTPPAPPPAGECEPNDAVRHGDTLEPSDHDLVTMPDGTARRLATGPGANARNAELSIEYGARRLLTKIGASMPFAELYAGQCVGPTARVDVETLETWIAHLVSTGRLTVEGKGEGRTVRRVA